MDEFRASVEADGTTVCENKKHAWNNTLSDPLSAPIGPNTRASPIGAELSLSLTNIVDANTYPRRINKVAGFIAHGTICAAARSRLVITERVTKNFSRRHQKKRKKGGKSNGGGNGGGSKLFLQSVNA